MAELLRCAFCGGDARLVEQVDTDVRGDETPSGWGVSCFDDKCPVQPFAFAFEKERAIEKWNRRTPPAACPSDCTCPDWLPGIKKLNAPLMLQFARNPHTTKGYDGPQFRFCPWCGGSAPK